MPTLAWSTLTTFTQAKSLSILQSSQSDLVDTEIRSHLSSAQNAQAPGGGTQRGTQVGHCLPGTDLYCLFHSPLQPQASSSLCSTHASSSSMSLCHSLRAVSLDHPCPQSTLHAASITVCPLTMLYFLDSTCLCSPLHDCQSICLIRLSRAYGDIAICFATVPLEPGSDRYRVGTHSVWNKWVPARDDFSLFSEYV